LTELNDKLIMSNVVASASSFVRAAAGGFEELMGGARNWRVGHLLGVHELRHRYARSRFGQLWLSLSNGLMIGAMGVLWSLLWNQPLREMIPFVGIGIIMWNYLAQVLTDCTEAFIKQGQFYRNQKLEFSVSIYSVIYRNTIMLAHNLPIIVVLVLAFSVPINWYLLQIVPAFALTWIMLAGAGYVIAMACVRYRDIIQIINSWLLVFFILSPVMWRPEFLPSQYRFLIDYNPLAQFLELLRNPFLGQPVSVHAWVVTIAIALGGGLLSLPVIGRYRRRVIYWI
jgi:ABC-type polysaccharide/polyol phosphate export permease